MHIPDRRAACPLALRLVGACCVAGPAQSAAVPLGYVNNLRFAQDVRMAVNRRRMADAPSVVRTMLEHSCRGLNHLVPRPREGVRESACSRLDHRVAVGSLIQMQVGKLCGQLPGPFPVEESDLRYEISFGDR